MAQLRGAVGIRWGTGGAAATEFGTSALMQSYDVERKGDEFEAKDGNGEVRTWYGYNQSKEATFTYYVGAATANASASVVIPAFGTLMAVTATGGSSVTSSYWIVKSATEAASNTDAVKITVKATEYQYITT